MTETWAPQIRISIGPDVSRHRDAVLSKLGRSEAEALTSRIRAQAGNLSSVLAEARAKMGLSAQIIGMPLADTDSE